MEEIQSAHPHKRLLIYYQDEARFGQHGTITRLWARKGSRPRAIRQTQYDYLYLFTAVCPETGDACGLITPSMNTDSMNAFLQQFSNELPTDTQAVLLLDRAGWHISSKLKIPNNVSLMLLPPKSPELNPTENLWHYLRSHYWSNRLYRSWDDLKQAALDAWRAVCLVPSMIQSICADTAMRAN